MPEISQKNSVLDMHKIVNVPVNDTSDKNVKQSLQNVHKAGSYI